MKLQAYWQYLWQCSLKNRYKEQSDDFLNYFYKQMCAYTQTLKRTLPYTRHLFD